MSHDLARALRVVLGVWVAGLVGCIPALTDSSTGDPSRTDTDLVPTANVRVAPAQQGAVAMLDQIGNWFYVMRDANGVAAFTQRGDFTLDIDGKIVYDNAWYVQGFKADDLGELRKDKLRDLKIVLGKASPTWATTRAQLEGNVNPEDVSVGSKLSTNFLVCNAAGEAITLYLAVIVADKTNTTTQLQFDVMEGSESGSLLARSAFWFNSAGDIQESTVMSVSAGGASPFTFMLQLDRMKASSRRNPSLAVVSQNGMAQGTLVGYSITNNGKIMGRFSNGLERLQGQFVVAAFTNAQALSPVSGRSDMFTATEASGPPHPAVSTLAD